MKKIIAVLMCLCLLFALCGCKENPDGDNKDLSSNVTANPSVASKEEDTDSSSEDTTTSEESDSSAVSSAEDKKEESKTQSSSKPKNNSADTSSVYVDSTTLMAVVNGYPVLDPYNSRRLSTKGYGYSYGIAKNGKPHDNSVQNQEKFDGYKNVKALALDTVSQDKRMYLTFDCGYEYKGITGEILDVLKEKNVKAAFFCTLDYLKKNPKFVRRMISEGHIVGNHSATHPVFTTIKRAEMAKELYLVEDYLEKNFNYYSPYFRFPTGEYSESALDLVTSAGYCSVFWSIAHADWDTKQQPPVDETVKTITDRFHNGAVILLHAVSSSNRDALGSIIDKAYAQGYSFKTLDDYKK